MSARTDWRTFRLLFLEEWRLHTELFGGWRFVLFPVLLAALAVAGAVGLTATGTDPDGVVTGLHVFALAFGLYSGTAAFAGSDMLENVFGRLSLLLSTPTTLPLSRRRLLGLFVAKDALFYAVVFVLPMALAVVPLEGLSPATPATVLATWASLSLAFAVGTVVTVAAVAVRTRGVSGWVIALAAVVAAAGAWSTGALAPVWGALGANGGLGFDAVVLAVGTAFVGALAVAVYDPAYARPSRTASDRFARLERALPVDDGGLVAKTLLDLARSSGGVAKPFVSAGILLALVAFLVGVVDAITGVEPAPGIFFGGVLGLSAFTTYNWLTQFDSVEGYLAYPVSVEAVFGAKRTAFLLVGTPAMALPYLGAVVWFDATLLDAAVGAVLLGGYALYYYGLTVYVAGFDPNEFLFDAVRFSLFTLGVGVALVPTLVAGFVVVPPSPALAAALAAAGVVLALVGLALSGRAGPRWAVRYRAG
ncbi:hypothetical protein [Salinilacihabitans rarus]|uniref:hypothetical protein n=1 Tax=Salinilacihabitans rarus TaxID=2961596 RepID=UPI0020C884F8|nr:hypothetical protein [Salinilacihabitans rarus]